MRDLILPATNEQAFDPRESLIDADIGASYTWLKLNRFPAPKAAVSSPVMRVARRSSLYRILYLCGALSSQAAIERGFSLDHVVLPLALPLDSG
jgi:hypothetical protein